MSTTPLIPEGDVMTVPEPDERWDALKGVGVAIAAAILVFTAVVGFVTLLNTSSTLGLVNTTLNDVKGGQMTNRGILNAINTNTKQTKRIADGLSSGNAQVSEILNEAGVTANKLLTGFSMIESQNRAICQALRISC